VEIFSFSAIVLLFDILKIMFFITLRENRIDYSLEYLFKVVAWPVVAGSQSVRLEHWAVCP
jgi:hypothetical protein